jgi:predicted nicotinamide N-methyase
MKMCFFKIDHNPLTSFNKILWRILFSTRFLWRMDNKFLRPDSFDLVQRGNISCDSKICNVRFQLEHNEEVVLNVKLGNALEDFNQTGQVIWPAAPLMAYFLLSEEGRRIIQDQHVVEVGAGIGIPGLLAGMWARSVMLTDHNPVVLSILSENVKLNQVAMVSELVEVAELDWASPVPPTMMSRFGVVLGADVVYSPEAATALFAAVEGLLSHAPGSIFILAYMSRSNNPHQRNALIYTLAMLGFLDATVGDRPRNSSRTQLPTD